MKCMKRKIRKQPFLFLLMVFSCLMAWGQEGVPVKGVVIDTNGETVIGASVVVKDNRSIGTITDIDGIFQLTVPSDKTVLTITFVGMKSKDVKVTPGKLIEVVLEDDTEILDEVVIVGYGQS